MHTQKYKRKRSMHVHWRYRRKEKLEKHREREGKEGEGRDKEGILGGEEAAGGEGGMEVNINYWNYCNKFHQM